MTILRVKHRKDYTCISNLAIRDKRLSFRARGLHHLLLSYPDGWRVNSNQLTSETDHEGRDAIRKSMAELERFGYLRRERIQDSETGKYHTESIVFELPDDRASCCATEDGFPGVGNPGVGNPGVGNPGVGKPGASISTDLTSTDQQISNTNSIPKELNIARNREKPKKSEIDELNVADSVATLDATPRRPDLGETHTELIAALFDRFELSASLEKYIESQPIANIKRSIAQYDRRMMKPGIKNKVGYFRQLLKKLDTSAANPKNEQTHTEADQAALRAEFKGAGEISAQDRISRYSESDRRVEIWQQHNMQSTDAALGDAVCYVSCDRCCFFLAAYDADKQEFWFPGDETAIARTFIEDYLPYRKVDVERNAAIAIRHD